MLSKFWSDNKLRFVIIEVVFVAVGFGLDGVGVNLTVDGCGGENMVTRIWNQIKEWFMNRIRIH